MPKVNLAANLRSHTDCQSWIELEGRSVSELIEALLSRYPSLRDHLVDRNQDLLPYVQLFVDQQSIRDLKEMDTPVGPHQTLLIMTALSGG